MKLVDNIYIASDLHIGYERTNYIKLHRFLDIVLEHADKLILVGDTFDLWRCSWKQIQLEHNNIIQKIIKISGKIPVIIVRGNHDYKLNHNLGYAKIVDMYKNNNIIYIHGWQFDVSQKLGSFFYRNIIRYFPILYQLFFKKPSETLKINDNISKQTRSVYKETIEFKNKHNAKYIVIGHTHFPCITEDFADCGDFVDSCSYLIFNNEIEMKYL